MDDYYDRDDAVEYIAKEYIDPIIDSLREAGISASQLLIYDDWLRNMLDAALALRREVICLDDDPLPDELEALAHRSTSQDDLVTADMIDWN